MPAWLQALAGAVVGGVLVAASNYLLFRLQRKATEKRELTAVVADFTGVLDQMNHELSLIPATPTATAGALQRGLRRMPNLESALRDASQRIWAPHLRPLVERFYTTGARLTLIAPPEILDCVVELTELLGEAEDRGTDWGERWISSRGRLMAVCRAELGQPAI